VLEEEGLGGRRRLIGRNEEDAGLGRESRADANPESADIVRSAKIPCDANPTGYFNHFFRRIALEENSPDLSFISNEATVRPAKVR
jgi:hypothetical protein